MINEVLEFTRGSQATAALIATDYGQFVEEMLGDLGTEAAEVAPRTMKQHGTIKA